LKLTTVWTCPEDAIVDCAHSFSEQGLETGLLPSDLGLYIQAQGEDLTGYPVIGHITAEAEVDQRFPDVGSDEEISGHPLSNAVNLFRVWEDLEMDLAAMSLESASTDRDESPTFPMGPRSGQRPAFFASALVHTTCLCLMAFFPVLDAGGTTVGAGNVIMMRVVAHEDVIPQDESPASIDSAESAPSKARRDKRREQRPPEPPRTQPDIYETGPSPGTIVMKEKPEPTDRQSEQDPPERERSKKPEDNQEGDALQDSAASLPSTASAERRFIPAAGREGNAFDAMVLSAIREAIFFPKAAFNQRHHGEVVVAFAITKDGSLTDLRITKPSESAILNEAAVKIIEKAAKKFAPLPDTVYRERLDYVVPILFKEKRSS
jgi:periplasmic protein TonB